MRATIRLTRVAGVDVGVHWSVLVIFALIATSLSAGQFPALYPGRSAWAYGAAGVSAAVVFFGGLLAHEVSHAVVARRNGVEVEDITLWMFGGVARLRGQAPTPGAELRIAGVGPLVSLLLGLGFGVAAMLLAAAGRTGLLVGWVAWLGGINVLLAVFNLLPAAPLDGGRILRAAVWRWRGDPVRASVVAARAGRVLGALLIGVGLWQFLATASVGGLWLALVGWFLLGSAVAEERSARIVDALAGVTVGQVMSPSPVTVPGDLTVAEFIDDYLWTYRHSAFPLTREGRPVGLVTLNRIRRVGPEERAVTPLWQVGAPLDDLVTASPQEPVTDLFARLAGHGDGRALVVDGNGYLVGIVTPTDMSRVVQTASLAAPPGAPRRAG